MKITKEYIQKELFGKTGKINGKKLKRLKLDEEEIYLIYFNKEKPLCECGNSLKFKSFSKGYVTKYCSRHCFNHSEYNAKQAKYNKSKMSKEAKENAVIKQKQTKLERYGNENYINSFKSRQTCIKNNSDAKRLEKIRNTNMERYGVEYKNNPEKAKITTLEKYGAVFPIHSDTIQKRKTPKLIDMAA